MVLEDVKIFNFKLVTGTGFWRVCVCMYVNVGTLTTLSYLCEGFTIRIFNLKTDLQFFTYDFDIPETSQPSFLLPSVSKTAFLQGKLQQKFQLRWSDSKKVNTNGKMSRLGVKCGTWKRSNGVLEGIPKPQHLTRIITEAVSELISKFIYAFLEESQLVFQHCARHCKTEHTQNRYWHQTSHIF